MLAALGRTTNNSVQNQAVPITAPQIPMYPQQQQMWQNPQFFHPQMHQPPPQPVPVPTKSSIFTTLLISLIIVSLVVAVVYWYRSTRMKEEVKPTETPSEVEKPFTKESFHFVDEEEDAISENILNFANKGNFVDLSGMDYALEERFPKASFSGKKIVADESQEVLDYAKKRESLFED